MKFSSALSFFISNAFIAHSASTWQQDHCFITEPHYTTFAIPGFGGWENQETQKPSNYGGQMPEDPKADISCESLE